MKGPTCGCFGSPADEVAIPFVVTHLDCDPFQTVSSLKKCSVVEFDQVAIRHPSSCRNVKFCYEN